MHRLSVHHSQSADVFCENPVYSDAAALMQRPAEDQFSPCLSPLVGRNSAFSDGRVRNGSLHTNRSSQDSAGTPPSPKSDIVDYGATNGLPTTSVHEGSTADERKEQSRTGLPSEVRSSPAQNTAIMVSSKVLMALKINV